MPNQEKGIAVRPLHPDDSQAIYNLLRHSFVIGNIPYYPGIEFSLVSDWLAKREAGVHRYVAVADGEINGLIILTQKLRPRLLHTGTISMAAHSSNRYEDTMAALMATTLDLADNWLNLLRVELELPADAKMGIDTLQSRGFETEGTRELAVFRGGKWLNHRFMARLRISQQWIENSEEATALEARPSERRHQVNRIEIRQSKIGDAGAFHKMLSNPAICRTTLQLPSQEIWLSEERLNETNSWLHRFTAEADGAIVGSIAIVESQSPGQSHIARIGMHVHPDYWGNGIGFMLMQSVTELADNWLNTIRIELDVNTDNPAGIRLYKKSGFVIEGIKRFHGYGGGRWADSYFMARIRKK